MPSYIFQLTAGQGELSNKKRENTGSERWTTGFGGETPTRDSVITSSRLDHIKFTKNVITDMMDKEKNISEFKRN